MNVTKTNEIGRSREFWVSYYAQYAPNYKLLYTLNRPNEDERTLMSWKYNGRGEYEKQKSKNYEDRKEPLMLAVAVQGELIYIHCEGSNKAEGHTVWTINPSNLELDKQLDISKVKEVSGKKTKLTTWAICAFKNYFLLMVSEKNKFEGTIHIFKDMKYLRQAHINHTADYIGYINGMLVISNIVKKTLYAYRFNLDSGDPTQFWTHTDAWNGEFALTPRGFVITVQPDTFIMTAVDPFNEKAKYQQKLNRMMVPLCGLEPGQWCGRDNGGHDLYTMELEMK